MGVRQQRVVVRSGRERWRRIAEAVGVSAAPAVVAAGDGVVDLFPGIFADVVDQDASRARLDRERERVAQAEHVNQLVDAGGGADERIVGGNQVSDGDVVAGGDAAVELRDVDAQLLAQQSCPAICETR